MINKYVTGLLAFLICACSTADTSNAVDMAKANLADSIAKFSDKETACRSNAPKLQTEQLKRLELTKEELVSALSFHYLKSYTECSYKEAADLIVRLKIVNLLQDDPSMSGEEASKIIVADMKKLLDLEIAYKSIPENKRRLIEDIQGLNPQLCQRVGILFKRVFKIHSYGVTKDNGVRHLHHGGFHVQ